MNATATQATTYGPPRMPPIKLTPYKLGVNDGKEEIYENPFQDDLSWLEYNKGHSDGRRARARLLARGRGR